HQYHRASVRQSTGRPVRRRAFGCVAVLPRGSTWRSVLSLPSPIPSSGALHQSVRHVMRISFITPELDLALVVVAVTFVNLASAQPWAECHPPNPPDWQAVASSADGHKLAAAGAYPNSCEFC